MAVSSGLVAAHPYATARCAVLVVTRDRICLQLFASILEPATGALVTADTLTSAIEIAKSAIPELIICDAELEEGGAATLCKILKSDEATKDIPILLALDSAGPTVHLSAALGAGADDFVLTSLPPAWIRKKLEEVLESNKRRRALNVQYRNLVESLPVIIDVTKRKQIEDALRESESRFRSLVETAASAIIALSKDGTITEWNREAERIYGHDRDSVLGKNYFDLFVPRKLRGTVDAQMQRVLAGEPMRDVEITIRPPDGSRKIILWNVTRQLDSTGNPAGLIAAGQDISERKDSEVALKASEERYRELFENANDIIYTRSMEGRFTSINKAAERITGFSQDEILEWDPSRSHAPYYRRLLEWTNRQTLANREIPPHEVKLKAKNGRKLVLEVSNRLILDNGKPVGIQGIARDVTERRQLHLQLAQTEKLSALGQLVSGVAHELNNPLTSVIGHAQLLLRGGPDSGTQDRLKIICKEGERARRIVQNLLSFSRQHNPARSQVNINDLIEMTLELRFYEMGVNNIVVSTELSEIPTVYADEHQLQQVLLNILINAEQAIAETNRGGRILVSTSTTQGSNPPAVVIRISDNGPGIPSERVGRVFDPFFTTKPIGQGTGLGLSISYGIVQEHKGSIKVESLPGSGATFIIELPSRAG
ncbi:MAG TPA: PAS domain S-box protein [Blastocatellia bacterium]|nr:PAS domain S-box protein [Blastocatellia bacterium]